jgi:hypothetical protein
MGETESDPYSRCARARLALCQAARRLADEAGALVPTFADGHRQPGAWVQEAAQLVDWARDTLERAVVAERERGTSWEDIGAALQTTRQAAHERFVETEREWTAALRQPYDQVDEVIVCRLPEGAHHPDRYAALLDAWVLRHLDSPESRHDEHPVSGHLPLPASRS